MMFYLSVTVALVLLSGTNAALPNVGSCSFMEYYCDFLKCNTDFIKRLQKDPKGDCSAKLSVMITCVKKTVDICAGHILSQSTINRIVRQNIKQENMCFNGALETPTASPTSVGLPCSRSFSVDAKNCTETFHQKFAADKSDPSLCQEQANAKQCLKKVMASECTFSASTQEALDLAFSDYNPFCANNRDPGATGNGICYGVKDLNNPLVSRASTPPPHSTPTKRATVNINALAASSRMEGSVLQILLYLFLLLILFFKA